MKKQYVTCTCANASTGERYLYADNGAYLGYALRDKSGFYRFTAQKCERTWPSYLLRNIANTLDELNDWEERIREDLSPRFKYKVKRWFKKQWGWFSNT